MFWREKELFPPEPEPEPGDKKCIFLTKLEKDLPQNCHSTQIIFLGESGITNLRRDLILFF